MSLIAQNGLHFEQETKGLATHQIGNGEVSQARNRNIAAAATTYASATNSATWTSSGVKELTITAQVNSAKHWTYVNYATAQSSTTLITGAGVLHAIVINFPVASATVTVYDNTAASGTKIALITLPAALLSSGPEEILLDVKFSTGLTIVTTGTNFDVTFAYDALTTEPYLLVVFGAPSDAVASAWLADAGSASSDVLYFPVYPGVKEKFIMSSAITRFDCLPLIDPMRVIVEAN